MKKYIARCFMWYGWLSALFNVLIIMWKLEDVPPMRLNLFQSAIMFIISYCVLFILESKDKKEASL